MRARRLAFIAALGALGALALACGTIPPDEPPIVHPPVPLQVGPARLEIPENWSVALNGTSRFRSRWEPWDAYISSTGRGCEITLMLGPVHENPYRVHRDGVPTRRSFTFTTYGSFQGEGEGAYITGRTEGDLQYRVRVFREANGRFALGEDCKVDRLKLLAPGLELVERSLILSP